MWVCGDTLLPRSFVPGLYGLRMTSRSRLSKPRIPLPRLLPFRLWAFLALVSLMAAACSRTPEMIAHGLKTLIYERPSSGDSLKPQGGFYTVGAPYTIRGVTYAPRHYSAYNRVGIASWYGPNFYGKRTANGEIFTRNLLTAAHTTLPLPSVVEVTNLENGRRVVVRVNDRGPFVKKRILDLSYAAAVKLDMVASGLARVRVRLLPKQTRAAVRALTDKRASRPPKSAPSTEWVLQVGSASAHEDTLRDFMLAARRSDLDLPAALPATQRPLIQQALASPLPALQRPLVQQALASPLPALERVFRVQSSAPGLLPPRGAPICGLPHNVKSCP